jgi:hypothetical protein
MLRKAFHSACWMTYRFAVSESNYRAELMALSVGRFAGSGVGYVPKFHMVLWQARPETPHLTLISLTSGERRERRTPNAAQRTVCGVRSSHGMAGFRAELGQIRAIGAQGVASRNQTRVVGRF